MAVPLKANPEGRHRFNVSAACHVLLHPIGLVIIPKFVDMLAIEGAIVSIEAMGRQRAIAQKIIDKKADYVSGLKANPVPTIAEARVMIRH
jgi:hypothetical protein